MDLPRSLLKDFAEITNDSSQKKETSKYVRGTVTSSGETKYVKIDGSSTLTPISEVVDVQDGDRVLVSIENHKATILGNFTFPPSARKEQEALDKAEDAQDTANDANDTASDASSLAQSASSKADQAIATAGEVETLANEAKTSAQEAVNTANAASSNAQEAKKSAEDAATEASTARQEAAAAQSAVASANNEIAQINTEITNVKGDINDALGDLADQAAEIEATKQTMELNYAKKTDVSSVEASLKTEISTKVGELEATVEETYAAKSEVTSIQGQLQTQITQNKTDINLHASKIETIESDTADAMEDVAEALTKAQAAQTAADNAQTAATTAQTAADQAKANAATAQSKAEAAQSAADAAQEKADAADAAVQSAQTDLNEAKQNLTNVTNRVGATEEEIAAAQAAVDAAQTAVNEALADAAEANASADQAKAAADKAQEDAADAQAAATTAQTKADNAQATADKAQEDALQAQKDVAALTSRVTAAETNISQNAEQISLTATKTEELGDLLENGYYTKTETEAAIELSAEGITSTVKSTITEEIGKVQVGGRNLFLDTGTEQSNTDRLIASYVPASDPLQPGETYTVTICVTPASDMNQIDVCFCHGTVTAASFEGISGTEKQIISNTFEMPDYTVGNTPEDDPANANVGFYRSPDPSTVTSPGTATLHWVKMEKGNKSTDWSPAPEEMATGEEVDNAQSAADEASSTAANTEERISEAESSIEQLANSISTLVTDENGNTLMEQTSDGWTFNISSITNTIEDAKEVIENTAETVNGLDQTVSNLDSLIDDLAKKTAYIIMATDDEGNPCIELGKEGNDFKVRITNTSVDFMEGTVKIAYVSNKKLFIETAVIKNELKIGEDEGFVWKTRSNGNMGLRWVEGS